MIKFGIFLVIAHAYITVALPPCVCTRNLKPVCGSDGQTYSNQCLLDCAKSKKSNLTFDKDGPCDIQHADCGPCTMDYSPVCGSDGNSYPNECAFDCAKYKDASLELRSRGQCETVKVAESLPVSCICTFDYKPVCGSDGKTYSNQCALECEKNTNSAQLEMRHKGECEKESVKVAEGQNLDCTCKRNLKPVCGSDGVTYNNICLLQCSAVKVDKVISVDHVGPCGVPSPNCTCTRNMKPVCGSDGATYNNECLMRCAGAVQAKEGPC